MNRNEFQDEVGRYWDVAYDEGARRATHDTEDGKAANVLRNIMSHYDALAARLAECEAECLEQARLNGMGSEREARLQARLAEAVAALHEIAHAHDADARRLRLIAADALIRHNAADSADDDYAPVTALTDYPRNDREQP